jgi:hypothetical protein
MKRFILENNHWILFAQLTMMFLMLVSLVVLNQTITSEQHSAFQAKFTQHGSSYAYHKTVIDSIEKKMRDEPITLGLAGTCEEIPKIQSWVKLYEPFIDKLNPNIIAIVSGSEPCLIPQSNQIKFIKLRLDPEFDNHDCASMLMLDKALESMTTDWMLYVENDLVIYHPELAADQLKHVLIKSQSCYMIGGVNHPNLNLPDEIKHHINGKALYNKRFKRILKKMVIQKPSDCKPFDTWTYSIVSKEPSLWNRYCRDSLFFNVNSDLTKLLSSDSDSLIIS